MIMRYELPLSSASSSSAGQLAGRAGRLEENQFLIGDQESSGGWPFGLYIL